MAAHQAPQSLGFSRQEHWSGLHFLLQCMKVKSESEVAQSCPTLCDSMGCSLPGSSIHGIFQLSLLEWVAISFSVYSRRVIITFGLHNYVSWDVPQLAVSRPENQESQWWNSAQVHATENGALMMQILSGSKVQEPKVSRPECRSRWMSQLK